MAVRACVGGHPGLRVLRSNRAWAVAVPDNLAVAFLDAFPLTAGHCLILPRRHEPDFPARRADEQAGAMFQTFGEACVMPDKARHREGE